MRLDGTYVVEAGSIRSVHVLQKVSSDSGVVELSGRSG